MNEYCCIPTCLKRAVRAEVIGSVTYASSRLTTYVDLCEEHERIDIPADVSIRCRALISHVYS